MQNQLFLATPTTALRQKLCEVICERTGNTLSEEQLQLLLDSMEPDKQYTILVYANPFAFCGALSSRRGGEYGKIVFGNAEFVESTIHKRFFGILHDSKAHSAAIISYTLHIYVPQRSMGGQGDG